MTQGYLSLVLHCHLPFVRHPEHETFMEEDWFFEAVAESYVPLLAVLEGLERDGVDFHVTLCISPTLCEMMADQLLSARCGRYLDRRLELMERELPLRAGTPFDEAALVCRDMFLQARRALDGPALLDSFGRLQDQGLTEIIACAATHALLPLLATEQTLYAQIEHGCRNYRKHFGRRPRGIWLPECAYRPGVEDTLAACGLEFFFLDSHGVLLADPEPVSGVFAPIVTDAGPAAFGRDVTSSKQVWSNQEGYPGDPAYREFYRDLGYDGPYEQVRDCLTGDGVRHGIGVKYYRITGDVPGERKEPYRPAEARAKAREHASHFLAARREQVSRLVPVIQHKPIIVSPYDAELFGHWWFEGPQFLDALLRETAREQDEVRFVSPVQYLADNPRQQLARPATSSWGDQGYFDVWMNGANDWIYPHLHQAERTMVALAGEFPQADGLERRALNQCARELMLAQASDWPFLISVGAAPHYAARRVNEHMARFRALAEQVRTGRINGGELALLESRDNIFSGIDYRLYSAGRQPTGPS